MTRLRKLIMLLSTPLPSAVRVWIYRRLGARIGPQGKIKPFAILIADEIEMGSDSYVDPLTLTYNLKCFSLGRRCSVRFGSMVYGHGAGSFRAGDFCTLGLFTMVNCSADVTFGDYCGTGPRCIIYTHGNYLPTLEGYGNQYRDVRLGDYVWLHLDVAVLPGVTIGDHVMVYSRTLVTGDIASGMSLRPDARARQQVPTDRLRFPSTPNYRDHWYRTVWEQLDDYARRYGRDGSVRREGARVRFTLDGRHLDLVDGMRGEGVAGGGSPRETLVTFFGGSAEQHESHRAYNWIDFQSCQYHLPRPHPLLHHVFYYLELSKAHYFYQWPGSRAAARKGA